MQAQGKYAYKLMNSEKYEIKHFRNKISFMIKSCSYMLIYHVMPMLEEHAVWFLYKLYQVLCHPRGFMMIL